MPFLQPDADLADGGWTTDTSGTTLFSSINGETPSDASYIKSSANPAGDVSRFSTGDPASSPTANALVKFRIKGIGDIDAHVRLLENSIVRAQWTVEGVPTADWTTYEHLLTDEEFDSITNWNNVRLEIEADTATLDINLIKDTTLDSRISITRGSSATYYDDSGIVISASANTPRFDHNPSTLERRGLRQDVQRTNYALRSEEFDNAAWTKQNASISATNAVVAPDGNTTAETLFAGGGTDNRVYQVLSVAAGNKLGASFFVKKGTADYAWLIVQTNGSGYHAWFNINTGVLGTVHANIVADMETLPNGWYRIKAVSVNNTGAGGDAIFCGLSDGDNSTSVTGGRTMHLWGGMGELGTYVSSYIPTTSAAVTRSADAVEMTGTNFSSWWSDTGTFVFEHENVSSSDSWRLFSIHDNVSEWHVAGNTSGSLSLQGYNGDAGGNQYNMSCGTFSSAAIHKIGLAFASNDAAGVLDAGTVQTDASVVLPSPNQIALGASNLGTEGHSGWLRRFRFYPTRKSNTQIQLATT